MSGPQRQILGNNPTRVRTGVIRRPGGKSSRGPRSRRNISLGVCLALAAFATTNCGGISSFNAGSSAGGIEVRASQLRAAPANVSFGTVTVGSSTSQTLTITNPNRNAVELSSVSVTGAGFTFSNLPLPLKLAPYGQASFYIRFSPSSAGSQAGGLSVLSDASNRALIIPLIGSGSRGEISVSPSSLSFGNVAVGGKYTLPLTVKNLGAVKLVIFQASASGAGFGMLGSTLPRVLAGGQSTSFSVTFSPSAPGDAIGKFSLTSNASNSTVTTTLSGTAVTPQSVVLNWAASDSPGVTGYLVYRGAASGGPYTKLTPTPVSGVTFTDTNVEAGQTYYYVTAAVNSQGIESKYSNQCAATVPSP